MKKSVKSFLIALIAIIIVVSALVLVKIRIDRKNKVGTVSSSTNLSTLFNEKQSSKYFMEEKKNAYNARAIEAESKDYFTLFIESNIFEGEKQIKINYDSGKYILNTANPIVENVEIKKDDRYNSFEISIASLSNYSIVFIKKDVNSEVAVDDISIEEIINN